MEKAFRIELDGRLVWEGDEASDTLHALHALAGAHAGACLDAYAWAPVGWHDGWEYVDVSHKQLSAMIDYELSAE